MIQTTNFKYYSILIFSSIIHLTIEKDSIQNSIDTCKYKLSDGKVIDLKKLDRPSSPRFIYLIFNYRTFKQTPFTYEYNPCKIKKFYIY